MRKLYEEKKGTAGAGFAGAYGRVCAKSEMLKTKRGSANVRKKPTVNSQAGMREIGLKQISLSRTGEIAQSLKCNERNRGIAPCGQETARRKLVPT